MRELRYATIAADLARRVEQGEFTAGKLLPSESALSIEYGASRVTVRRALERLKVDGLVDARQGFGWFAADDPSQLTLGRLSTLEADLVAQGRVTERRVLDFATVTASDRAATVLGPGQVLRVRRLNLADGVPFARVTVWVPHGLAAGVTRQDVARAPFRDLLGVSFTGATQTIAAAACSPEDAELLEVPAGSPVLHCERTTFSQGGPVLLAEHVLAGLRAEFKVDLPVSAEDVDPAGLRLRDL